MDTPRRPLPQRPEAQRPDSPRPELRQPQAGQVQTIKMAGATRSIPLRAPGVLAAQMVPRPTPMPSAPIGQQAGQTAAQRPVTAPRPPQPAPRPPQQPAPQAPSRSGTTMPTTSARASGKIDELFQVIRQLCELLTKENAALKRHRTEEVKSFAERKEFLARSYQAHMTAIQRDRGPITALDPARRALLSQQAMRLGELMTENAALLRGSIQAINMYFKAVTDAVREKQETMSAAYSRRGAMNGYIAKRSLAVSFNQTM